MTIATRKPFGWTTSFTGFGTQYPAIPNQPGDPSSLCFSSSGGTLIASHRTSVYSWPWSAAGAGTRHTNVNNLSNTVYNIAVPKNDNNFVAIAGRQAGLYLTLHPFDDTNGVGTRYPQPGTNPTGLAQGVAFHPTQQVVFTCFQASPYTRAYRYSSSGFGMAYSPPSPVVNYALYVNVHPAGDAVLIDGNVYPWTYAAGFGTKYADPQTAIPGYVTMSLFSPDGTAVIFATTTAPYLHAYAWNSATGFGTKYPDPPTGGLAGSSNRIYFSPDGGAIIATSSSLTGTVGLYKWSTSGFGSTMYTNSANVIGVGKIAFNPASNVIAVGYSSLNQTKAFQWQS